jgi:hypothetical protein
MLALWKRFIIIGSLFTYFVLICIKYEREKEHLTFVVYFDDLQFTFDFIIISNEVLAIMENQNHINSSDIFFF